jgi:hypothetical protein
MIARLSQPGIEDDLRRLRETKISHIAVPLSTGNDKPGIWPIGLADCQRRHRL